MSRQETWIDRRIFVQRVIIDDNAKTVRIIEAYSVKDLSELIDKNEDDDAEIEDFVGDTVMLYDGRVYRVIRD